ncbi:MAG: Asp-tRNA(Asn)/Glu-tRNA(Gln) amidotransferase subunit GatA [Opitutales bacterium]|nr:Asp-tRNA(Asn)/Glu-tRNA(Gln) amidotransferase subunit GatA [Opitutales bacterium]MDG1326076.1 Asp-tRNA(Asn)/Glu-tRNA(Gln) amidotransferase subunit GatA [Opitutales bacterium]
MSNANIVSKTAVELSHSLSEKELSSQEIAQAYLEQIDRVDPQVHAFLHRDDNDFLAQASASDKRRAEGNILGPLDGIPVAIKDVISVQGQPLTAASKILENYISPYDATVIRKLKAAGAVIGGRLNLDEFAMGSSTENSAYGPTRNPWDFNRVPGGSSGGSSAAVAAREAPLTLGSDTGGSIRQPASLCGVVGVKPTYGMVSRYGLAAFASSLDQIGPFSQTVEDAALLLETISGHDPLDSTSYPTEVPQYSAAIGNSLPPCTLGLPKEFFGEGIDDEVRKAIDQTIEFYRSLGHKIVEVSLPTTDLAVPVYYVIATAEASSNLARYDGIRYTSRSEQSENAINVYAKSRGEGFGEEVKRRCILGAYGLSSGYYDAYYLKAQKTRTLIREDFNRVFEEVDVILTPTAPTPAFKFGEKSNDPISMYLSDIFTISTNLAGLPALSVPCGFTQAGLPIGMQLIGQAFEESNLLSIAHAYDREHLFGCKSPNI